MSTDAGAASFGSEAASARPARRARSLSASSDTQDDRPMQRGILVVDDESSDAWTSSALSQFRRDAEVFRTARESADESPGLVLDLVKLEAAALAAKLNEPPVDLTDPNRVDPDDHHRFAFHWVAVGSTEAYARLNLWRRQLLSILATLVGFVAWGLVPASALCKIPHLEALVRRVVRTVSSMDRANCVFVMRDRTTGLAFHWRNQRDAQSPDSADFDRYMQDDLYEALRAVMPDLFVDPVFVAVLAPLMRQEIHRIAEQVTPFAGSQAASNWLPGVVCAPALLSAQVDGRAREAACALAAATEATARAEAYAPALVRLLAQLPVPLDIERSATRACCLQICSFASDVFTRRMAQLAGEGSEHERRQSAAEYGRQVIVAASDAMLLRGTTLELAYGAVDAADRVARRLAPVV